MSHIGNNNHHHVHGNNNDMLPQLTSATTQNLQTPASHPHYQQHLTNSYHSLAQPSHKSTFDDSMTDDIDDDENSNPIENNHLHNNNNTNTLVDENSNNNPFYPSMSKCLDALEHYQQQFITLHTFYQTALNSTVTLEKLQYHSIDARISLLQQLQVLLREIQSEIALLRVTMDYYIEQYNEMHRNILIMFKYWLSTQQHAKQWAQQLDKIIAQQTITQRLVDHTADKITKSRGVFHDRLETHLKWSHGQVIIQDKLTTALKHESQRSKLITHQVQSEATSTLASISGLALQLHDSSKNDNINTSHNNNNNNNNNNISNNINDSNSLHPPSSYIPPSDDYFASSSDDETVTTDFNSHRSNNNQHHSTTTPTSSQVIRNKRYHPRA